MARISIKKNFVDGDKLFAQQLNNNFETIEKAVNDGNKIVWQDGTEVTFKRYVTSDIDSLPISDGAIIYDTEKGRHYIDYQGKRIQVGSAGKEVVIQEEQPTEEDNKLWIDSDIVNTIGTEVVNSLEGNETTMAPSVNAVNKLNTYSTEEQRIGTYLGKPLYSKTYVFTEYMEDWNDGIYGKSYDIDDIDYDKVWYEGFVDVNNYNGDIVKTIPLNYIADNTTNASYFRMNIQFSESLKIIFCKTNNPEWSKSPKHITLKYTKKN